MKKELTPYIKNHIAALSHPQDVTMFTGVKKLTKQQIIQQKYVPLKLQIQEIMKSTPQQLLNRPWTMSEFVSRLSGKYRLKPHTQLIGQTLRILGWKSVRYWKHGYNGTRVWLPPSRDTF
jgi:hypothetical protein